MYHFSVPFHFSPFRDDILWDSELVSSKFDELMECLQRFVVCGNSVCKLCVKVTCNDCNHLHTYVDDGCLVCLEIVGLA